MTTDVLDVRRLLDQEAFAGVVATVLDNNPGMDETTAELIVTDALAYVAAAARHPYTYMAPSRTVDEGWHALILHTALYAKLCEQLGTFIHHYPERPDPTRHDDGEMEKTLILIRETGHQPHMPLWTPPTDDRIPVRANCKHSPKPGGCSPIEPRPKPPSGAFAS
ncbi:hypothetical protein OG552_11100 [Streptomyces sp. NBC_01476]|uniref:hypothetical protein n=1 Tax=Streptomyces sp. NBC_01476 TaxID=2903881 RepID=UPI002E310119|nr:hypothetical protein [Streptomyces sp. NBC_01476]